MDKPLEKRALGKSRREVDEMNVILSTEVVRMGRNSSGSESCPVAGFGINGIQSAGSDTTVLVFNCYMLVFRVLTVQCC